MAVSIYAPLSTCLYLRILAHPESCEAAAEDVDRRLAMDRYADGRLVMGVGLGALDWQPVGFPRAIDALARKRCGVRVRLRLKARMPGRNVPVCAQRRTGDRKDA